MKLNFAKPAGAPVTAPAAPVNPAPVVEVAATVATAQTAAVEAIRETVPTPVAGVQVETVTTVAPTATAPAITMTVTNNDNSAVAVRDANTAVAVKEPAFYDDDSVDAKDLTLPRLVIVAKVGELSNNFPSGSLLLTSASGNLILAKAPEGKEQGAPIRVLVVGFQPVTFAEKVDGGLRGNEFKTEKEVAAAGGTTDYTESQATKKPWYQRKVSAMILIEQPLNAEGKPLDDASFPMEIEGKKYTLALYTTKGSSYTNFAKVVKSAKQLGHVKAGYRTGWWKLSSVLDSKGSNFYFRPITKADGASTEAIRSELLTILGS